MIYFIFGGSSSGKSEYAESLAVTLSGDGNRYYIATMDSNGEEAKRRIEKHLAQREGKGFITVECPHNICDAAEHIPDIGNAVILLESVPTLLANEMFGAGRDKCTDRDNESSLACRIGKELINLCGKVKDAVLVSDNIFEDGMEYDELSRKYAQYLGEINKMLAEKAQRVTEINALIPHDLTADTEEMAKGVTLVIGGFAQGKLSWVLKQLSGDDGESVINVRKPVIIDEKNYAVRNFSDISDMTDPAPEHLIINHLHLIVKKKGSARAAADWLEEIITICNEKNVSLTIISDEVGNGVVPADIEFIRYRENVGDTLRFAARNADRVYKVTCGIPLQLK